MTDDEYTAKAEKLIWRWAALPRDEHAGYDWPALRIAIAAFGRSCAQAATEEAARIMDETAKTNGMDIMSGVFAATLGAAAIRASLKPKEAPDV